MTLEECDFEIQDLTLYFDEFSEISLKLIGTFEHKAQFQSEMVCVYLSKTPPWRLNISLQNVVFLTRREL